MDSRPLGNYVKPCYTCWQAWLCTGCISIQQRRNAHKVEELNTWFSQSICLFLSSLLLSKWPVGWRCQWCPLLRRQICPNAPAAPSTTEDVSLRPRVHTKHGMKAFQWKGLLPKEETRKPARCEAGVRTLGAVYSFESFGLKCIVTLLVEEEGRKMVMLLAGVSLGRMTMLNS